VVELISYFSSDAFMPHGHCYLWEPFLLWLQVFSNGFIALAYISISITLAYLVYKVGDLPFKAMYLAFGIFIVTCGITHLSHIWVIWNPDYWTDGMIRAVTAVASVGTAIALPPLVPKALALARGAKAAHARGVKLETMVDDLARMYEQTKQVEEQKTRFFANVSHELRTPLTLILGPADKLSQADNLDVEQRRDAEVIARNARTLLKHVEDLLAVARLEAGQVEVHYGDVELSALVQSSAAHFTALAAERDIEFTVDIPATVRGRIDRDKIQRVVLNLLSNAFKFTPLGGRVRCTLTSRDECAYLEIADSGPGIAEADRDRVFDRFAQADQGPTRRHGGTGLGLAIVRDFVNLHGGTIEVGNAAEGGARFTVELPIRPDTSDLGPTTPPHAEDSLGNADLTAQALAELRTQRATSTADPGDDDRPRVLVVEDNADMNRFVCDALGREFAVDSAFDGAQGLERALAAPPDLIVTDLMMPTMTGAELMTALRERDDTREIPVAVLSAGADRDTRVELLRQGASDYLMKPFTPEELLARAHNLIGMKRARDLLRRELDRQAGDVETLARDLAGKHRELETALETVRVALDAAEQASRAKSTFLGVVSHELRTPLQAMNLQLTLLARSEELQKEARAVVERLTGSVRRLHELIESVLEHTRIESGKLTVSATEVDLARLCRELTEEYRDRARDRGLALSCTTAPDLAPVRSDEPLLRVVLGNLVANAIKFTASGEVQIDAGRRGPATVIAIRDTGPGIPAAARDRIFDPFTQLEETRRKHIPGVGLGLTLVRDIVAALGGSVEVTSEVGAGSTFRVVLPDQALPR
jgi:signal transduction histidine kinase